MTAGMAAPLARFGPFEIVARLGVGGMGEVFLARRDGGAVALKLIRPEFARDAKFRRMFANEARIGARLRHDNLVRVVDEGELDGVAYLAMDYVDGVPVDRLLQTGPLSPAAAVAVMCQLLRGLAHAHELRDDEGRAMNVLHRDVSCSNVLVSVDGTVKLTDFGIGRADDLGTTTSTQGVKGKRSYLAPELLAIGGAAYSRRSDLYACGVVFHRLLTASLPDEGAAAPPPYAQLVARALAIDPLHRFASAPEMLAAIEALGMPDGDGVAELRARVATADRGPVALPAIDQLILAEMRAGSEPVSATETATRVAPAKRRDARSLAPMALVAVSAALAIGLVAARARRQPAPTTNAPTSTTAATTEPAPPTSRPPQAAPPAIGAAGASAPAPSARHVAPPPTHATPPKTGLLTLDTEPWGTAYFGARRLGVTPLARVALPAGRHELQLDVRNSGHRRTLEVNVIAGSEVRVSVHLPAAATATHRSTAAPPP